MRICIICNKNEPVHTEKRKLKICKNCDIEKQRYKYRDMKNKILKILGNKCNCCNESDIELLCIDHIYNDGALERKKYKGKAFLKKLLKQENITDNYQCLCYNCNCCKGFYGKCWHQVL